MGTPMGVSLRACVLAGCVLTVLSTTTITQQSSSAWGTLDKGKTVERGAHTSHTTDQLPDEPELQLEGRFGGGGQRGADFGSGLGFRGGFGIHREQSQPIMPDARQNGPQEPAFSHDVASGTNLHRFKQPHHFGHHFRPQHGDLRPESSINFPGAGGHDPLVNTLQPEFDLGFRAGFGGVAHQPHSSAGAGYDPCRQPPLAGPDGTPTEPSAAAPVTSVIEGTGPGLPGLGSAGLGSQGVGSPSVGSQGASSPDVDSLHASAPCLTSPSLRSPGLRSPGLESPDVRFPDLAWPDVTAPDVDSSGLGSSSMGSPVLHPSGLGSSGRRRHGVVGMESVPSLRPQRTERRRDGVVGMESAPSLRPQRTERRRDGVVGMESVPSLRPQRTERRRDGVVGMESAPSLRPQRTERRRDGVVAMESAPALRPQRPGSVPPQSGVHFPSHQTVDVHHPDAHVRHRWGGDVSRPGRPPVQSQHASVKSVSFQAAQPAPTVAPPRRTIPTRPSQPTVAPPRRARPTDPSQPPRAFFTPTRGVARPPVEPAVAGSDRRHYRRRRPLPYRRSQRARHRGDAPRRPRPSRRKGYRRVRPDTTSDAQ